MSSTETATREKVVVSLRPPTLWKVIFLNDDNTSVDLVMDILMTVFNHSESKANDITLEIHNEGSGVAGIYSYEIAEQKGLEATSIARQNNSQLKIQVEQEF